jgi:hypothetical protein
MPRNNYTDGLQQPHYARPSPTNKIVQIPINALNLPVSLLEKTIMEVGNQILQYVLYFGNKRK